MNDVRFDATLVAAAKRRSDDTNTFATTTMKRITAIASPDPKPRRWIFRLHKPALALAAFVAVVLLGSAVYAAVHFAPAFIQMLGKEKNSRGATEYSVSGFMQCAERNSEPATNRFEIKSDAPHLSDDEVHKIIQAKCELKWLETFPENHWPKQSTSDRKGGKTVTYARLDVLGTLDSLSPNALTITPPYTGTKPFMTQHGETIKTYASGEEVNLSAIKKGDAVFTIARFSEPANNWDTPPSRMGTFQPEQPKPLGIVGVFKLSLPLAYYTEKQSYITEIPECEGNTDELCPQTPSIDVYPRTGGEGATNPYHHDYAVYREISGEVTTLTSDTLTLKSRSGKLYSVTVGDDGFEAYNRDFTAPYAQDGIDAHLKVGSRVAIRYTQPKESDPTKISKDQVQMVSLQLEALNPKQGSVKQY